MDPIAVVEQPSNQQHLDLGLLCLSDAFLVPDNFRARPGKENSPFSLFLILKDCFATILDERPDNRAEQLRSD